MQIKKYLLMSGFFLFIFAVLPQVSWANIIDDSASDFDAGSHSNTQWDSDNSWLEMDSTGISNGTATFTSRVFDSSTVGNTWDTFSWVPQRPLSKELPDSDGVETAYTSGNVDMTNSTLLLHLNEGSGNVADTSGGNASMTETALTYGAVGKLNTALTFNGTTSELVTGLDATSYFSADTKTVSVWVYPTGSSPSVSNSYAGHRIAGGDCAYTGGCRLWGILRANISGTDKIWAYNWDSNEDKVGVTYNANEWTHIVMVHSGGTMYIYKNGILVDSVASGNTQNLLAPIRFGSQSFAGSLDEIAVFSRALSDIEIANLYKRGALRIKYQVRTCSSSCTSEDYVGQSGSTSNWFEEQDSNGTDLPSFSLSGVVSNNRYFQYKAVLETSSGTLSPEIKSITAGTSATESGSVPEFPKYIPLFILLAGFWFIQRTIPSLKDVVASTPFLNFYTATIIKVICPHH